MKGSRLWAVLFGCGGFIFSSGFAFGLPASLQVCDDAGEWPPFVYLERMDGQKTSKVAGLSVSLIHQIADPLGIQLNIELLPWKRCLQGVKDGKYHMLLNATVNDERREEYLISNQHSQTTPYYFYINGKVVSQKLARRADLGLYRVGGIHGYNYSYYGLEAKDVQSQGIYNYGKLIHRLQAGEFDLFVENYEILAGFSALGENYLETKGLAYAPIPEMSSTGIHMMFTKSPVGEELKHLVDEGLTRLQNDGTMQAIQMRYFNIIH
ncbi:MAG: transporter substrate-binding domain-containing protein [Hahellaceae bacterium]|nr:transporter substrate-binding domain-containing protein [Hahellaceae bacterium]